MIIAASPAAAEFRGKKELCLSQLYIDVWSWPEISAYWYVSISFFHVVHRVTQCAKT